MRALVPLIRRDPRLIAFGGPFGRFTDNPAYLFLHKSAHSELRCVWVSDSKPLVSRLQGLGLDAVTRWSLPGVRVAARASWYVFCQSKADVNTLLSDGAVTFNLWHGVGLKRISRLVPGHWKQPAWQAAEGSLVARLFADERQTPDWVLSTTPPLTRLFASAFDIPEDRCLELGYPRIDHLTSGTPAPQALIDPELWTRIKAGGRIVGYFPTFRDETVSIPGGVPVISELARIVAAQRGTLVFKAHHETVLADVEATGVIVLPREADLNAYLGLCDVIVTDYSSVANDFLVLDRPIVHFVPDLDDFAETRGFAFDPLQFLPGVVTRTTQELYEALGDLDALSTSPLTDIVRAHFWGDTARPGACERVAQFIRDQLTSPTNNRRTLTT